MNFLKQTLILRFASAKTLVISYMVIFFGLSLSYVYLVVPYYEYYGFSLQYSIKRLLASLFCCLVLAIFSYLVRNRAYSFFAYNSFYVLAFLPQSVLFSFGGGSLFVYVIYTAPFIFIALFSIPNIPVTFVGPKISKEVTIAGLVFVCISSLVFVLIQLGSYELIKEPLRAFWETYKVRADFKEAAEFPSGYMVYWLPRVFLPLLLIYSIKAKNSILIIFTVLSFFMIFLVTAVRSVVLIPLVIAFFYYIFSGQRAIYSKIVLMNFVVGFAIFLFLAIDLSLSEPTFLSRVGIRRVFFSPVLLSQYYYEFFSANEKLYLTASKVNPLMEYPYEVTPPILIGKLIDPGMSANTGFVTDGFMNGGVIGVIIYSIFLAIMVRFFDVLRLPSVFLPVFGIGVYSIISTQITTAFATHGLALFILFGALLINRKHWSGSIW